MTAGNAHSVNPYLSIGQDRRADSVSEDDLLAAASKPVRFADTERMDDDARTHLAWLMWCFKEGYTNAEDRALVKNWLLEDPSTLHPDDAKLRPHLLAMADEILRLIDGTVSGS